MAPTPDVRVRLSAEGVQEVVNAFKRVQAEAEKAGKSGNLAGRGISFLTGQISSLARALPALTVGAAVAGFVALTKNALELADSMGKLNQKTGISVETLSTLSFAARTADLEQDQLRTGLIKFTKAVDDYDQGASSARNATRQLFGDARALEGLNTDERLLKVVNALAKLEPGAKRTGAALDFFGKSGAELLPLIDDLGDGGFDKLREKAERLGLVIDRDLADAAQRANDAMTDLRSTGEGIALQFASGFAPAVADVGDALVGATGEGAKGFKDLGDVAGNVLKAILLVIATVAFGVTEIVGKAFNLVVRLGELAERVLSGDIGSGWEQFRADIVNDANALEKQLNERSKKFLDSLLGQNRTGQGKQSKDRDRSTSKNLDQLDKEANARRELEESLLDNALKLQKANLALREQAEKESFERGTRTIADHYRARKRLAEEAAQAEIRAILQRIDLLERAPLQKGETQSAREKKTQELRTQAIVRQIELETELAGLANDERKAQEQAAREQLSVEAQLAEAQGRRFEAARLELEAQIAGIQRLKGETDEAFAARKQTIFDAGLKNVNFDKVRQDAESALAELEARRQEIENQVRSGILFQTEGEQELLKIERDRLPVLQQLAQAMLAAAQATGDPAKIAQAQQFSQAVREWAIAADQAGQKTATFKQTVEQALDSSLLDFFTRGIDQAKSLGDAVRGMALGIVDALRQWAAELIVIYIRTQLIKAIGGLFGIGGGGGTGKAGGGLIRGPGSSTSDSIPVRLSDCEFVVRSAVVKQPGVLEFLRDLNAGGAPAIRRRARGFADGGLVEITPGGSSAGDAGLTATLGLDEGLVLQRLEAHPRFKRVIIRTLESNRKAANTALGRHS